MIRSSGLQEAVAIGRTFAAMKDYQIDGNKEMVALGTMNIVGSMTSCYVATGGLKLFNALLYADIESLLYISDFSVLYTKICKGHQKS